MMCTQDLLGLQFLDFSVKVAFKQVRFAFAIIIIKTKKESVRIALFLSGATRE